jgi:hypothetical protein
MVVEIKKKYSEKKKRNLSKRFEMKRERESLH